MNCTECKAQRAEEAIHNPPAMIPYIIHEDEREDRKHERRRWFIALLISVLAFLISNSLWLYCWMQYDYVSEDSVVVDADDDGVANYIGEDGDIVNGQDYRP